MVSQNPKAPLTGEQLNAMPPEVQANIHRMLSARNQDALSKGSFFGNQRAIINGSTDELSAGTHTNIGSFDHDTSQKLGDRQKDYTTLKNKGVNVADAGTPLAEAALNNRQVIIHSISDIQSLSLQQMENGASINQLFFINGTQFLKNPGAFIFHLNSQKHYEPFTLVLQISKEGLSSVLFKELVRDLAIDVYTELGVSGFPTESGTRGRVKSLELLVPYTLVQNSLGNEDSVALKKILEGNTNLKNNAFVVKDNKSLCKNLNITPIVYKTLPMSFKLID